MPPCQCWDCLRAQGWRGFYRGFLPSLIKTAPASAVTFLVFDKTRELILRYRP